MHTIRAPSNAYNHSFVPSFPPAAPFSVQPLAFLLVKTLQSKQQLSPAPSPHPQKVDLETVAAGRTFLNPTRSKGRDCIWLGFQGG